MPLADQQAYDQLCQQARDIALLGSINSLLGWDERVLLPPAGGEFRAEQMTFLAAETHKRWTSAELQERIAQLAESDLAQDPYSDTGATLRELKRECDRRNKLPARLVEELARVSVLGQRTWQQARKDNDFPAFQPLLEKIVGLKREEAEALGYEDSPYDALLDEFEPGERTANLKQVLGGLRDELVPLVAAIRASGKEAPLSILERHYPAAAQKAFGFQAAAKIGFEFERGRLDETAHPFCSGMGPGDCRITTRYDENFLGDAFFGILHEAGHGIYDQGLLQEQYGLPLGSAVSLGIHESQSRMWENFVGRSRAFWEYFYGDAQAAFPQALGDVNFDDFYFAVNDVRPSLIRTEADEVTYNLHVLIRFELEQALINDGFAVADLPQAWNDKYQEYLDIVPPDDADGVLQDIHWSGTMIGYFPTYSLGNLYAAQFFRKADEDLGGLEKQFAQGEFLPLREWLRENIHRHGQRYPAPKLVEVVTGQPLSHAALVAHLKGKFGPLYGI